MKTTDQFDCNFMFFNSPIDKHEKKQIISNKKLECSIFRLLKAEFIYQTHCDTF